MGDRRSESWTLHEAAKSGPVRRVAVTVSYVDGFETKVVDGVVKQVDIVRKHCG